MKVVIKSSYPLRNTKISSYHSFPEYSDKIEETMSKLLEFLKQYKSFSLTFDLTK